MWCYFSLNIIRNVIILSQLKGVKWCYNLYIFLPSISFFFQRRSKLVIIPVLDRIKKQTIPLFILVLAWITCGNCIWYLIKKGNTPICYSLRSKESLPLVVVLNGGPLANTIIIISLPNIAIIRLKNQSCICHLEKKKIEISRESRRFTINQQFPNRVKSGSRRVKMLFWQPKLVGTDQYHQNITVFLWLY